MIELYSDAGMIDKNPTHIGVTWAWKALCDGEVSTGSGVYLCAPDFPEIENNFAELLAAVTAVNWLRSWYEGHATLFCDNQNALGRLFEGYAMNKGVPGWLISNVHELRPKIATWNCVLLQGHPTKKELEAGIGKSGRPVSLHNVDCDNECRRLAAMVRKYQNG